MALTVLFLLLVTVAAQNSRAQSRTVTVPPRPAPDWTAPHVAGQLLVKLNDASPATAATLAAQTGMSVQNTIPELGIVVVEAPGAGTERGVGDNRRGAGSKPCCRVGRAELHLHA